MATKSEITFERIRGTLSNLIAEGLVPFNVADNGWPLLELEIVRDRIDVPPDADEEVRAAAYTHALTSVLADAVEHPRVMGKSRRLLRTVLPLSPEYLGTSVKERRAAAGEALKPGARTVKPGTIRTYYEPKALDRLAEVLIEMEEDFREGA